jgi:hypothetical protein
MFLPDPLSRIVLRISFQYSAPHFSFSFRIFFLVFPFVLLFRFPFFLSIYLFFHLLFIPFLAGSSSLLFSFFFFSFSSLSFHICKLFPVYLYFPVSYFHPFSSISLFSSHLSLSKSQLLNIEQPNQIWYILCTFIVIFRNLIKP